MANVKELIGYFEMLGKTDENKPVISNDSTTPKENSVSASSNSALGQPELVSILEKWEIIDGEASFQVEKLPIYLDKLVEVMSILRNPPKELVDIIKSNSQHLSGESRAKFEQLALSSSEKNEPTEPQNQLSSESLESSLHSDGTNKPMEPQNQLSSESLESSLHSDGTNKPTEPQNESSSEPVKSFLHSDWKNKLKVQQNEPSNEPVKSFLHADWKNKSTMQQLKQKSKQTKSAQNSLWSTIAIIKS